MTPEERILSLGVPVEDPEFIGLLRSRLHVLLNLTRNPEMFPGSQPVSFEKRHLDTLEREDYYVCEKSDGVRYLLYFAIPPSGPVAFLIDRNYNFRALDHLTLPTKDLKGYQEETLLDGELVWDERKQQMVYYIFDGIMFMARNLAGLDLNGRLQTVQNGVIGPLQARDERNSQKENVSMYERVFPFRMKMKQMWKPYGLRELFERVIPSQGHENDGLIFTPVKDAYMAGTCHRLLKWKPSDMNSIDFLVVKEGGQWQLFIATQGRVHYYTDFDPKMDDQLVKALDGDYDILAGKVAEFRMSPDHVNKWTFMRLRPDKRLPNDSKTVEKVLQSIRDNVKKEDLLEREASIRANWKARESSSASGLGSSSSTSGLGNNANVNNQSSRNVNNQSSRNTNNQSSRNTYDTQTSTILVPRSQLVTPKMPFSYPLNLRTSEAKAAYAEYDGWYASEESKECELEEEPVSKRIKL